MVQRLDCRIIKFLCRHCAAFSFCREVVELAATRLIALHKNKGKSVAACLKSRTDYAQNPDKTQQGELVSSYECSPLTVDEEFMLSKRQYELAIMASRALESKRDRFKVMLVTPFMSCNARLTIYILFSEMFFGDNAMLMAYSMYLIGIVVAIVVSAVIHLLDRKKSVNYLMIELPEYKLPDSRTVAIYVWEKVKDYLEKAGTTIFIATLVIWLLLNFGPHGYSPDMAQSFGAMIGKWLVPFFAPIGLGFWQIAVALIAGVSAKEVVVSSCAVLFGIVNASSPEGMSAFASALNGIGFGPLNAFCLMVFCLLYIPCAAALATIRKESGSWIWMGFAALFQLAVAWIVTFGVYQIGSLVLL